MRVKLLLVGFVLVASVWPAAAQTEEPSFRGLGFLPGGSRSEAFGISGDGRVAVGRARTPGGTSTAVRWVDGVALPLGAGPSSTARAASFDGAVIVGDKVLQVPIRWEGGVVEDVEVPSGEYCSTSCLCCFTITAQGIAPDVSAAGDLLVTTTESFGIPFAERVIDGVRTGFRYELTDLAAVSFAGSVLAGSYFDQHSRIDWPRTAPADASVFTPLPGSPTDVSGDGRIVVGSLGEAAEQRGYRWQDGSYVEIPGATPAAASEDGDVLVGSASDGASVWDPANGWRDLRSALVDRHGLAAALAGWTLTEATGVSADGLAIVGNGVDESGRLAAWRAVVAPDFFAVPEPPAPLLHAAALLCLCGLASTRKTARTTQLP